MVERAKSTNEPAPHLSRHPSGPRPPSFLHREVANAGRCRMGRPIGPRKVHRYSMEFKLTAVKLSGMPGVQVQTVANALDIHPFMLSRWRKEARDGMLRGRARRVEVGPRRELKRLQMLEREHAMLQEEHELLKKAIRFCSAGRRRSSRSLTASAGAVR